MSESTSKTTGGGVSFMGLLAILFIGLKLGNVIAWPWLWVLAPLWLPIAVALAIIVVVVFFAALGAGVVALVSSLTPKPTAADIRFRRRAA